MVMNVNLQLTGLFDPREFKRWEQRLRADNRKKAATAMTRAVWDARAAVQAEMKRVFVGGPTPWALSAVAISPATAGKLQARVFIRDEAGKGTPGIRFLGPQIFGGGRGMKRHEKALQAFGLLPKGYHTVPGGAARLNMYGNMSAGQIVQILSQLRVQRTGGYESRLSADPVKARRAVRRAGGRYFVGRPGGQRLRLGVWQKTTDGRVRPVLIFVPTARYRKRLDFFGVAKRVAIERFAHHFGRV